MKQKFYRIELAFDGEPQHVGFFTGIDDVGLSTKTELKILDSFRGLQCPDVVGYRASFWFTQAGFEKYLHVFRYAQIVLSRKNWGLLMATLELSPEKAIWSDEDQAAFDLQQLPENISYQEF